MPDLQWMQWVGNFGFAAIVALYVLVRLEPCIKRLTEAVWTLAFLVAKTTGQDIEAIRAVANGRK